MKKVFTLILCFMGLSLLSPAQTITGITPHPASPNDQDTLKFYVYLEFPSSPCEGNYSGYVTGTTIRGEALHCMGMLTAICNTIDTIVIPPQPAGSYNFIFSLHAGIGTPSCSSPTPDDVDTVAFIVSPGVGLSEAMLPGAKLDVYPNPSLGQVTIKVAGVTAPVVDITDQLGRMVYTGMVNQNQLVLNLDAGAYLVKVRQTNLVQKITVVK